MWRFLMQQQGQESLSPFSSANVISCNECATNMEAPQLSFSAGVIFTPAETTHVFIRSNFSKFQSSLKCHENVLNQLSLLLLL